MNSTHVNFGESSYIWRWNGNYAESQPLVCELNLVIKTKIQLAELKMAPHNSWKMEDGAIIYNTTQVYKKGRKMDIQNQSIY